MIVGRAKIWNDHGRDWAECRSNGDQLEMMVYYNIGTKGERGDNKTSIGRTRSYEKKKPCVIIVMKIMIISDAITVDEYIDNV